MIGKKRTVCGSLPGCQKVAMPVSLSSRKRISFALGSVLGCAKRDLADFRFLASNLAPLVLREYSDRPSNPLPSAVNHSGLTHRASPPRGLSCYRGAAQTSRYRLDSNSVGPPLAVPVTIL